MPVAMDLGHWITVPGVAGLSEWPGDCLDIHGKHGWAVRCRKINTAKSATLHVFTDSHLGLNDNSDSLIGAMRA